MPDSPDELRLRALRHLARREHSRAELARKLAPHAGSPQALTQLLDALLVKGQQSDERFAEGRARVLSRKYGPARIRHDLRAKGVDEALARSVLPADELERARAILARRYGAPAASPAERARRARFLQGRGFSAEIVFRLLRLTSSEESP